MAQTREQLENTAAQAAAFMIRSIVPMIYKTSDKGAYKVHYLYKSDAYLHETALKEYIYAKLFMVKRILYDFIAEAGHDQDSSKKHIDELYLLINAAFQNHLKQMPETMNYGANDYEASLRLALYEENVPIDSPNFFVKVAAVYITSIEKQIPKYSLDTSDKKYSETVEIMELAYNEMIEGMRNPPKTGGCLKPLVLVMLVLFVGYWFFVR